MQPFEQELPPALGYRGVYINLDRSIERRQRMERQLTALGLTGTYARFPAIDGQTLRPPINSGPNYLPGAYGCFRSHIAAMEWAMSVGGLVHVVEDDVILSRYVPPFMTMLSAGRVFEHFDIVFLDMWIDPGDEPLGALLKTYAERVQPGRGLDLAQIALVDMRGIRLGAMGSYVVSPKALPGLVTELRREVISPRRPVDRFVGSLVRDGKLRAALCVPFLTGIDPLDGRRSLIQRSLGEDFMLLIAVLRNLLFVDRDLEGTILPTLRLLAEKHRESPYNSALAFVEGQLGRAGLPPQG